MSNRSLEDVLNEAGDPVELAADYQALRTTLPRLNVLGGCCGTDYRHVQAIAAAWGKA